MKFSNLAIILVGLLGSPASVNGFVCSGNKNIDIPNGGETDYACGSFEGPVRLVWKVTGNDGIFFGDEYSVKLKKDGSTIYESEEFSDEQREGKSGLVGGDDGGLYVVTIRCRNESFNCGYGSLQYKLVQCGCESSDQVVLSACDGDRFDSAEDATCGGSCDPGFYSDPDTGCTECPNFQILATADVSYDNLVGIADCGVQGTTGFWSLAASGSVGADGTVVAWSLSRSQSASDGVERTNEFSRAYGQVRGSSTSFETSVNVGFAATASAGLFGTGVSVETSVDLTTTVGRTRSWEVSTESTNSIGNAVSSAITKEESITCEQSCGPNPDNPDDVQGFIFNWVDAIFEENTGEILHYVRTCATVCKYDSVPPLCPPGKCFNRDCNVCQRNAFKNSEVDALASRVPSTPAPSGGGGPAPGPSPTPSPSSAICFAGNVKVEVQGKGIIAMEDIRVGDVVKSGQGTYEPVYAFAHREPKTKAEFVQIHTDLKDSAPLEISEQHLVFVVGKVNPVRADSLVVDDVLTSLEGPARVKRIKRVSKNGIYNPLLPSGTIVVDGIVASNYIAFQTENKEYIELQGGFSLPMSHHSIVHIGIAPFRFVCTHIMVCDDYDSETGLPGYVSRGIELVEWGKRQNIIVQAVVLGSGLVVCLAFMTVGYLISGLSVYQSLLALAIAWKYLTRNKAEPTYTTSKTR